MIWADCILRHSERVVAFVEEGNSHRASAARLRASVKFVNDMVILKREIGGLTPRVQGNGGGHSKLIGVQNWVAARMDAKPDLTLNDLVGELADHHGISSHRVLTWQFLQGLGLTHKKDLQAVEQKRLEVRQARHIWITQRQPFMRNAFMRIGFIDETSTENRLKAGGVHLRQRLGFQRAAVGVARKLAVVMHTMLKRGERFNPLAGSPA